MNSHQQAFVDFAITQQVLRFGHFTLKSGRESPYFFDAGLFHTGQALTQLGRFYAQTIMDSHLEFDILFGPAYKGIPLAVATAIALAEHHQRDLPYCFNRKEVKDHGEGGTLVGASLHGKRVLLIDDVISAGTAIRESVQIVHAHQAQLVGVVIALDRQERGKTELSAIEEVKQIYQIPVLSIINLDNLISYLATQPTQLETLTAITAYREKWVGIFTPN